jgi:ribosomal protein L7/L12
MPSAERKAKFRAMIAALPGEVRHDLLMAVQQYMTDNGKFEVMSAGARAYMQHGEKINAIKQVREDTGLSLREAKDIVDDYEKSDECQQSAVYRAFRAKRGY